MRDLMKCKDAQMSTKGFAILSVGIYLLFSSIDIRVASAELSQVAFRNCEAMASALTPWGISKGVALNAQTVGFTGALVDAYLYQVNKKLDIDKDGVACEGKIYDLSISKNSAGVTYAYSACKSKRAADQNFIFITSQLERYYSESDKLLAIIPMHELANTQMQNAAKQNSIFKAGAMSAKFNLDVIKKSYLYSLKGKQLTGGGSNFDFDNWCALFGVYSSHKGMFPPIELKFPQVPKTSLNGARQVCQSLFIIAPSGELLYSGDDSISLTDCDRNARRISVSASSYDDAFDQMINIYFTSYDFWCWGRNNCKTEWDIR